jgi:hypothetical protein
LGGDLPPEGVEDMLKDIESSAASLYDGGWRARDREQLMQEHDLMEDEADSICTELEKMDGRKWTEKDLIEAIQENIEANWLNSDLHRETEIALTRIAKEWYEGKEEDIECILEKLNSIHGVGSSEGKPFYYGTSDGSLSLQDVEQIIQVGEWYFQQG